MYIYTYVYIRIYLDIYIPTYICIYIYIYTNLCVCALMYVYEHVLVHHYICTCLCPSTCRERKVCANACINILCIYIYIICIYIYSQKGFRKVEPIHRTQPKQMQWGQFHLFAWSRRPLTKAQKSSLLQSCSKFLR